MTFRVSPSENFREQRNVWKGIPDLFSRSQCSKRKFVFHFIKAIFDTDFRPSRLFFGKWNRFVQIMNAIPGTKFTLSNEFCLSFTKP